MANDCEDRNELQSGSLEKVSGCFFFFLNLSLARKSLKVCKNVIAV